MNNTIQGRGQGRTSLILNMIYFASTGLKRRDIHIFSELVRNLLESLTFQPSAASYAAETMLCCRISRLVQVEALTEEADAASRLVKTCRISLNLCVSSFTKERLRSFQDFMAIESMSALR